MRISEEQFNEATTKIHEQMTKILGEGPSLEEYRQFIADSGFSDMIDKMTNTKSNVSEESDYTIRHAVKRMVCGHAGEVQVNPADLVLMTVLMGSYEFTHGYAAYPLTAVTTDETIPESYFRWKHDPDKVAFEEMKFYLTGEREGALVEAAKLKQVPRLNLSVDGSEDEVEFVK